MHYHRIDGFGYNVGRAYPDVIGSIYFRIANFGCIVVFVTT